MKNVEPHFIIHGEHGEYAYRIRPNPDCDVSATAEHGLVIEYSEDGNKTWTQSFFIGPNEIESVGLILLKFAEGNLK